jgi:hypothetical protein
LIPGSRFGASPLFTSGGDARTRPMELVNHGKEKEAPCGLAVVGGASVMENPVSSRPFL